MIRIFEVVLHSQFRICQFKTVVIGDWRLRMNLRGMSTGNKIEILLFFTARSLLRSSKIEILRSKFRKASKIVPQ